MSESQNTKQSNNKMYDLEERTFQFAKRCRDFIKKLLRTITNIEYGKQLARSSGSQAANYIEANEKLGDKDFKYRLKISRKEVKESMYWLRLLKSNNKDDLKDEIGKLYQESDELRKIVSAIINKT